MYQIYGKLNNDKIISEIQNFTCINLLRFFYRVVTTEEAAKKAEKENLFFVETSAKTDFQIKKVND